MAIAALKACSYAAPVTPTPEPTPLELAIVSPIPSKTPTPTTLPATKTPLPTASRTKLPPSPTATQPFSSTLVLGESSAGWPVEAFRFGTGPVRLVLIGGIHGGYEWNTILLAYEVIDYFNNNPADIPPEISLYIIPAANPDGQVKVVGATGRFSPARVGKDQIAGRVNSNGVDLNRNWDCNWESKGVWRNGEVSAGKSPFSEIETQILRDFLTDPPAAGVVFWHSAVPAIYAGGCKERHAPSDDLALIYADASGYSFELQFTAYPVTGNAVDWLALQGIPAIEVELNDHRNTDFDQNLKAIFQVLEYFQKIELKK